MGLDIERNNTNVDIFTEIVKWKRAISAKTFKIFFSVQRPAILFFFVFLSLFLSTGRRHIGRRKSCPKLTGYPAYVRGGR